MAKILFEITIIIQVCFDIGAMFSGKYMQMVYNAKKLNEDAMKIIGPRRMMIIVNVINMIFLISMFFYYKHFCGFQLAFGLMILEFVGAIIDNTYEFLDSDHPIVTDKTVKIFIRLIALIEMLMLIKIGIVGWNFDK